MIFSELSLGAIHRYICTSGAIYVYQATSKFLEYTEYLQNRKVLQRSRDSNERETANDD